MSVNLEFILKFKEYVAPGLDKLAGKSKSIFNLIDKDITNVSKHLYDLGKPSKLNFDTSGITNAKREVESLKRSMEDMHGSGGGFWKSSGAMMMGSLAARGIEMAGRKAYEMGREALSFGSEMEKSIVGLSNFVGDKNAVGIVDRVVREGVFTPYKTSQLLPIEQGLIASAGVDKDRAHRDTWSLANVVAGVGGGDYALERMGVMHLPQIAAQGYMEGMQRREFAISKIPIDKILADYMGVKQNKISDMVSDKKITYDVLTNALYKASQSGGMFSGAMDKLSQTIGGKWSTVVDKFQIAEWKIIESQSQNVKALEDRMMGFADKLPGMAENLAGDFNKMFSAVDILSPTFSKMTSAIYNDFIDPLKNFALSDSLTGLINNIGILSTTILNLPGVKETGHYAGKLLEAGSDIIGKEVNVYRNLLNYAFDHDQYNRDNDPYTITDTRKGYMWGTAPVGTPKGYVVDSAAYKKTIQDKGINNFFADNKAVTDWDAYLKKWYPKTAFDVDTLPLPMMPKGTGKSGTGKVGGSMGGSDASDAIVSGGSKSIIININAPIYKVDHQSFQTVKDAINDFEPKIKEALERLLYSIPAH